MSAGFWDTANQLQTCVPLLVGHGRPGWGKERPTDRAGHGIGGHRNPKNNLVSKARFRFVASERPQVLI